jgi:DNA-binding NtrC family response regulator
MASIALHIRDGANRITLEMMLRAAGHVIVPAGGDAVVTDDPVRALREARERPALVLATAGGIAAAVEAMRQGVYGYIFLPFQLGEAVLMVARALGGATSGVAQPVPTAENGSVPLEDAERAHIEGVLRGCKGNRAEAARRLGIGRNTLWRKLRRYRDLP